LHLEIQFYTEDGDWYQSELPRRAKKLATAKLWGELQKYAEKYYSSCFRKKYGDAVVVVVNTDDSGVEHELTDAGWVASSVVESGNTSVPAANEAPTMKALEVVDVVGKLQELLV
jgi:hypothetical protein